ncbi:monosaccharide ABC transporter substrate-binding protein, CUT2 family [Catenulispora acidiphila DSM 44928]|uniref:Monosaccharide ABC transporter substrate-binding protein, CUT2 family n=1 Tax=Catenulispora acidiphila (strain DSM 44928 / JCM 14897 / NBRC 102108 / NRRL B-24433 / ID139908) TaxID=479433 RepID=C7PX48_CATAD|nr:substrate-binding domain-containing protein [Catenulispora acidiphila]ACU69399.1 monosaccharide ABC transporter substrate-binding protein, CUT2 family [Catenulispora acidiphila DSM 44928]
MRHSIIRSLAVGAVAALALGACSSGTGGSAKGRKPYIGVILPDTTSSARWATQDQPALAAAFKAKNVKYDIQNAQGNKTQFQAIADHMLKEGVNILMIVDLDAATGTAVLAKARQQGVPTIDYDRLTLGGGADYYVSFDNVDVGELQGQGLVACLGGTKKPVVAEVNGSPTDNNATLFAQGYNSVLNPLYADGTFIKGPNQSTTDWKNDIAGQNFAKMLAEAPNIGGVLVANDGMAQAVIGVLKQHHLNGRVQVTGQDATVAGLQSVLVGDQCMTIFKDSVKEANAAAELATALATGGSASSANTMVADSVTGKLVASVMLTPEAIVKQNVGDVISAGAVTKAQVCTPEFAEACTANGIK